MESAEDTGEPKPKSNGQPALETELRAAHREAARQRPGGQNPNKYVPPDETNEITFHPRINKAGPSRVPRVNPVGRIVSTVMTTRSKQELLELQECTFQPNLHKCLTMQFSNPRYRTQRRPAAPPSTKAKAFVGGTNTRFESGLRKFEEKKHYENQSKEALEAGFVTHMGKHARRADNSSGDRDWGTAIRVEKTQAEAV